MKEIFDGPPTCIRDGTIWSGSHCLHSVGHNEVRCCGACGGAYIDPASPTAAVPDGFMYRLGFWHTPPGPLWSQVKSEMKAAGVAATVES